MKQTDKRRSEKEKRESQRERVSERNVRKKGREERGVVVPLKRLTCL